MKRFYPFVSTKCNSKNGELPVYIRYNYDRLKRTLIPINQTIKQEHWNYEKMIAKKSCPNHEEINNALNELSIRIGHILEYAKDNYIDPTINYVTVELSKKIEYESRAKRMDLFAQLDKYIEEKKTKVSTDVIKDYNALKKHLNGFKEFSSQPITFNNLNMYFYNEFVDYLCFNVVQRDKTVGLLNNSVGKQIKNLKAFVRDRISKKVIPHIDLSAYKRIEEETDHIYLSEKELEKIVKLDLSSVPEIEKTRDLFIIGCYTGLRYSDLYRLSPAHIDLNNEVIKLTQRKVHRAVTVPMIDYVPNLLKKYDYNPPKMHLNEFNIGIKEIGKLAGFTQPIEVVRYKGKVATRETKKKYELISSHTCRRSFCTNMYLFGFPAEELMKISGHKSTSAFLRYIKVDDFQAALRLKKMRKSICA